MWQTESPTCFLELWPQFSNVYHVHDLSDQLNKSTSQSRGNQEDWGNVSSFHPSVFYRPGAGASPSCLGMKDDFISMRPLPVYVCDVQGLRRQWTCWGFIEYSTYKNINLVQTALLFFVGFAVARFSLLQVLPHFSQRQKPSALLETKKKRRATWKGG